jgi:hypothetical protein
VLDAVMALRRPADYSPDQGARFEVHFEKTRGFYGKDAQPFEARYEVRDGTATWSRTEIVDAAPASSPRCRMECRSVRRRRRSAFTAPGSNG